VQESWTYLLIALDVNSVVGYRFRDAKIDNFETSLDKHEVCWFEVGVNDVLLMHCLNRFEHLPWSAWRGMANPLAPNTTRQNSYPIACPFAHQGGLRSRSPRIPWSGKSASWETLYTHHHEHLGLVARAESDLVIDELNDSVVST
jgi:hypothetical protein